jgi:thioredoxin 1
VKPKLHGADMRKVLRFTASWCQPCKTMAKLMEDIDTNLPIEVIDIDERSELAVDYGIRSVPTLVMLDENIEVRRMVGLVTKEKLKNWIEV